MSDGKEQIVRNTLRKMNLTKDDNDPEKEPYASNPELAARLGLNDSTIISNVRRNLIFARNIGISMDCIDCGIVYAWRWSGDDKYAKIGVSIAGRLRERMISTYHPTDDALLIGISKYDDRKEAQEKETSILNNLTRAHPKREWVIIDEDFNKLINEEFTRIEKIVR